MMGYLLAGLWGLAVLASMVGWGRLAGLTLLGLDRRAGLGLDAALGISLTIAVGAWLNLGRGITSELLIGYVTFGVVLAAALGTPRSAAVGGWFHDDPAEAGETRAVAARPRLGIVLPGLALAALAAIRYAAAAQIVELCPSDDPVAYLLFPVRMLSEGSLGDDPFNNRRLISSLGGLAFLQAIVLSATGTARAALADSGLGLLVAVAGGVGLARARGVPPSLRLIPASLVLLDPFPASNLSSFVLPVPLILTLARLIECEEERPRNWGRWICVGLVGSSLAALKSSMIPFVAAMLLADAALRLRPTRGRSLGQLAVVGLVGLILAAPWMVSLRRSSGTYLYPLLGVGTHGRQYGTFLEPNHAFTAGTVLKNLYQVATDGHALAAAVLALGGLLASRRAGKFRPSDLAVVAAWLATLGLMAGLFEFKDTLRYAHPLHTAVGLIFAVRLLEESSLRANPNPAALASLLAAVATLALGVGLTVGGEWESTRVMFRKSVGRIRAGLAGMALSAESDRRRYEALQESVPEGVPILTRLSQGELLDFRRNRIHVADWPGGASPAPGLPCFQGPEPLAAYLINQGIRYVAYSYADQCNFPKRDYDYRTFTLWDRVACQHAYDFQDNLSELMKTRERVYDDGRLVMLDLGERVKN